jgi:hypothetical protein
VIGGKKKKKIIIIIIIVTASLWSRGVQTGFTNKPVVVIKK